MSTRDDQLPIGFETLEPFVAQWAASSADLRMQARLNSSESERLAFHAAASARLDEALERLDGKPLAQLDAREQCLMHLLLSLAHIALAVEQQGDDEAAHGHARRHMTITRASADA